MSSVSEEVATNCDPNRQTIAVIANLNVILRPPKGTPEYPHTP